MLCAGKPLSKNLNTSCSDAQEISETGKYAVSVKPNATMDGCGPSSEVIDRWRFALPDKGSFFRIWSPTEISVNWPGRVMTDRDADYAMGALYELLLGLAPAALRARATHDTRVETH
jgi:hypothetical protein